MHFVYPCVAIRCLLPLVWIAFLFSPFRLFLSLLVSTQYFPVEGVEHPTYDLQAQELEALDKFYASEIESSIGRLVVLFGKFQTLLSIDNLFWLPVYYVSRVYWIALCRANPFTRDRTTCSFKTNPRMTSPSWTVYGLPQTWFPTSFGVRLVMNYLSTHLLYYHVPSIFFFSLYGK